MAVSQSVVVLMAIAAFVMLLPHKFPSRYMLVTVLLYGKLASF